MAEETTTETRNLTAAEAISEILVKVDSIDSKLDEIIGFINEAGEQINAIAGQGLGSMLAGVFSQNGD